MRNLLPLGLAVTLALGLAADASAVAMLGTVGANDCSAGMDPVALRAELYGFKVKADGSGYDDILADLSIKTGSPERVGGAIVTNPPTWGLPDNFRLPEAADDVVIALMTLANGQIAVNSGVIATTSGGNQGVSHVQVLGAGIPAAWGIRNAQDTSPSLQAGNLGVDVRFAPVMELTGTDTFGPASCRIGASAPLPDARGGGILLGYNVYRLPGTASAMPTTQDFYDATLDGIDDPLADGGWVYLARTAGFDLTVGDASGRPAPADDDADGDLTGMNNPDATGYTGDDRVIFQDSGANPDASGRAGGADAPSLGGGYWYAFQPVVKSARGTTIAALGGVALSSAGSWTITTSNLVAGGGADAADLDGDGTIELFSPQADAAVNNEGYGLTNGSLPLLSAPVFIDWQALAAADGVSFTGTLQGDAVSLQLQSALESGNVLGFNVYRQRGDSRVLVNDQPIVAGAEGSVYTLVDELGQASRRLRHGGSLAYTVDVLYNDGSPTTTLGPFAIETSPAADAPARGRRQR